MNTEPNETELQPDDRVELVPETDPIEDAIALLKRSKSVYGRKTLFVVAALSDDGPNSIIRFQTQASPKFMIQVLGSLAQGIEGWKEPGEGENA